MAAQGSQIKVDAEDLAKLLTDVTLTFRHKVGENDQLFGSVTAKDIAEALEKQNFHIDRRKSCSMSRSAPLANTKSRCGCIAKFRQRSPSLSKKKNNSILLWEFETIGGSRESAALSFLDIF